jgi:hypothetical protein
MHLYMKIVKEKGEKEKGKRVMDSWARGGISAQPAHEEGERHGRTPWARAHSLERGGLMASTVRRGRGEPVEVDRRRGSAVVLRRGSGFGWSGRWLSMGKGRGSWWQGQFGQRVFAMAGPRRGGGLPPR